MQTIIVAVIITAAVVIAIRHCINILKNKGKLCGGCPNCDNKSEKCAYNDKKTAKTFGHSKKY